MTENQIKDITNKIQSITGNPCELSQGSKLIIFTYNNIQGYINIDMADYCIKNNKLQDYFTAIELLEPKE